MSSQPDPLLLLRQSISTGSAITPIEAEEASSSAEAVPLSEATHLQFSHPALVAIPIDAPTRFFSNDNAVNLRSIYFAWLNREVAIPEYNASASKLNEDLAGKSTVHQFGFVERVDLITWLEGASEESDHIRPLAADKEGVVDSATTAAIAKGSASAALTSRPLDPRLAQIYSGERRTGDRNSVLRGMKPADFSQVRKLAAPFMSSKKNPQAVSNSIANNPSLSINQKPVRRPDPIILLSPSASALLRLSNVKSFLESGRYVPPDGSYPAPTLHLSRLMREMDPDRPLRFVLVEGTEQFKPEYWNRVVAVFTTGQSWQFKSYKWSNPAELFKHVLGVYVGWRGEAPPSAVREYGHRVLTVAVEKWRDPSIPGAETSRWRDREIVETIWKEIEKNMRAKGWRKDIAPSSI